MTKLWLHFVIFVSLISSSIFVHALETHTFTSKSPQLVMFPDRYNPETGLSKSRLLQVADDIKYSGSLEDIRLFARIAISEMVIAYENEAIYIQNSIQQNENLAKDKRKYSAWGRSAFAFAEKMNLLHNQIDHATEVEIITDDQVEVLLMINNTPVIVSSPVINQQASFENDIIQRVCEYFTCNESTVAEVKKPTSKLIRVKAGWKLEANEYVFYTFSGLHFPFSNQEQKQDKEKFALMLARDLNLLSGELEKIDSLHLPIEWHMLNIKQIDASDVCEVKFNSFGDAVYMELRVLQDLIKPQLLVPWLQKRLHNTQVRLAIEDIDELYEKYKTEN